MVLVIGIVVSSVYETKTIVSLPLGAPLEFAGYRLRYDGLTPIGDRARLEVTVADARATRRVAPILRPGRDGLIRNPAIFKRWTHDLYLEPGELKAPEQPLEVKLDRTTPVTLGDLTLAFDGFELTDHQMDPNDFRVGIKLRATRGGETTVVKTALRVRGGAFEPEPGQLPGGGSVAVMDMPPKPGGGGDRYLVLEVQGAGGAGAPETAVLQVTVKPLMSVVWLGCWMTILGGLWAAVRRAVEATRRRAAEHPILHLLENRHGE